MTDSSDRPGPTDEPTDWDRSGGSGTQPEYHQPGYDQPGYDQAGYGQPGPGYQGGLGGQALRPGIVPLRPLAVGDLLAGAFAYIRTNPLMTLGLAAVVMAVSQGIQLIVSLAVPPPDPADLVAGRLDGLAAQMLGGLGASVVSFPLGAVLGGLLLVVLSRAVLGQRSDFGSAWRTVAPRLPGLIGLSLLIGLVLGAFLLVTWLPVGLAAVADPGSALALLGLSFVLTLVVLLGFFYLIVLWALAPAAYVLEPIGVVAALGRSRQLVRGAWWRTFGIIMLTGFLIIVPLVAVQGLFGAFSQPPTTGTVIRSAIATFVVLVFAVPFGTGVSGLLYTDQRIRRERFDVELARRAGGQSG